MGDEHDFFDEAGRVAVDHGIFFRVKAAAVAGFVAVTAVVKTGGIAVVAHSQDFPKVSAGDDCANLEALASRAMSEGAGQAHVDFREGGSTGLGWVGFHPQVLTKDR